MALKKKIKKGIAALKNPEKAFLELKKVTLEDIVSDYMHLLLLVALAVALFNIIYSIGRTIYLAVFLNADISYVRLINYITGQSFTILLIYILAGTIVVFLFSFIMKIFFRKIKYTELLKIILVSLYPFLLFGWIPRLAFALIIWSIFLFVLGIRINKDPEKIKKDSIFQRD
jgi:hypothetical protein